MFFCIFCLAPLAVHNCSHTAFTSLPLALRLSLSFPLSVSSTHSQKASKGAHEFNIVYFCAHSKKKSKVKKSYSALLLLCLFTSSLASASSSSVSLWIFIYLYPVNNMQNIGCCDFSYAKCKQAWKSKIKRFLQIKIRTNQWNFPIWLIGMFLSGCLMKGNNYINWLIKWKKNRIKGLKGSNVHFESKIPNSIITICSTISLDI